ncbi:potassium transporter Kup [Tepidimonas taiwanensis]|uniref:Probable potassium transport system protein Kup n=1 Tax=Tepidimonas taiwanensis TaxID=307486 RepID=A0A554XA56_9BURK|nr:potassium transporter Kup [Tepidimonas taiwanensis]MCX7692267.1 potassium transporter Kup [Tepidimonas taiwanensis]TSE32697.1 Low affinity potassium transport system protein kup [Tepidimonas taiwanensis]UBQ05434.1 potassium transporter Kup [Tepidimonas taiwanensis]
MEASQPPRRPLARPSSPATGGSKLAALTLGAIGVVYGDIGTSPLYALKEVFTHGNLSVTPDNILGILSLVFWTLTVIVSLKYVTLILRADNNGEGGLVAMLALASMAVEHRPRLRRRLLVLGIFGTAIFFGDAIITPAISVLSAVEGLEVAAPGLEPFVVPVTLVVLTALFAVQKRGTASVGKLFGPITAVWFVVLALLGLMHLVRNPAVLQAVLPHHALRFILDNPGLAFVSLGAIVLCVTGAEALYADLGHFGKRPIRLAWFGLVMPALLLNYFGQGAMLLQHPENVSNPFYEMAPTWALVPLIGLATCATVIASQALISAAYSVTKQVVQLGYLPRQRILHTSVRDTGQIYVPSVNWALYGGIVGAVLLFGSSSALASAYGIAVTINMLITTVMTFFVVRYAWRYPWLLCVAATGVFLVVDALFFTANAVKVFNGGWFPLAIGAVMFTLMTTWQRGRQLLAERLRDEAIDLKPFLDSVFLSPPVRVPGTAVFLNAETGVTPNALLHNLKHNKVLHETNLFVSVRHHEVPWIGFDKRVEVEPLGHDCWRVVLHFGFKNDPDVPEALQLLRGHGVQLDDMETSYFLSREIVLPRGGGGMMPWRKKLFAGMHRNAASVADFLNLPANRVVELGAQIEI